MTARVAVRSARRFAARGCRDRLRIRRQQQRARLEASGGDLIAVGEAAQLLGVCAATLRVWDRQGSFVPHRTLGGHRRYQLKAVLRLRDERC